MRPFISGLKIPLSVSKAQIGMASLSSMPCGECWCCWWFLGNEAEQTECSPVRFINWRKSQAMSSINWDNFWSNFRISIWPPWKGSHLSWLRTNITNTRGRVEFHRSSVIRVFPNHDLAVEKVPGHGLQYDHILFSKPLSNFYQNGSNKSCFILFPLPHFARPWRWEEQIPFVSSHRSYQTLRPNYSPCAATDPHMSHDPDTIEILFM